MTFSEFKKKANNRIAIWIQNHGKHIPDRLFLQIVFYLRMGRRLHLRNPKTFNEKLQWLKLYNRRPEYTRMVDKLAVKDYVAALIGSEHIIPTLGVWERAEDIAWDKLPDRFVLKTTHGGGSGGVVICKDKASFDRMAAINKLNRSLGSDIYESFREWPYKDVPRCIIAEEYIDPSPKIKDLPDYMWYCFAGVPRYCQVIQDRSSEETIDFFDTEWNHQEFVGLNPSASPAAKQPHRPVNLELQIKIARELSKDIPFSRIDLYETGENTYFGEVTFYPASCFGTFRPEQYNDLLGQMLQLPGEKRGGVIVEFRDESLGFREPDLRDYKFFCFDGEVRCFKIDFGRQTDHHANYYDVKGNLLPFGEKSFAPIEDEHLEIPASLPEMIRLAEQLSGSQPFLRVDFYDHHGKVLFGEITFYPASGMGMLTSDKWDRKLGDWIKLPQ